MPDGGKSVGLDETGCFRDDVLVVVVGRTTIASEATSKFMS